MNTHRINYSVLIFITVISWNGCTGIGTASFGSSSKVLNEEYLKRDTTVCLFPVILYSGQNSRLPGNDSIDQQLWKEIDSHKIFKLIPIENSRSAVRGTSVWDSTSTQVIAKLLGANAIFYARINYSKETLEPVATLSLRLVDSESDSVVAYGFHDTYLGNSYFLPPSYETVTSDAIKGAVNALVKSIMDEKKK